MEKIIQKEKGITLIALIITIIVMLILVGVTINVALNGGLFESATTAATETKKEAEKEQLLSAVVGAIGTDGKVDSTKISLPEGFTKDESKSTSSKLVVKGKEVVWQVNLNSGEIEPYSETSTGLTTYTFTIEDLANKGILGNDSSGGIVCTKEEFFPEEVSEELENSTKQYTIDGEDYYAYNITCSDSKYTNVFNRGGGPSPNSYEYLMCSMEGNVAFGVWAGNNEAICTVNYTEYKDLSFTVSMW